MEKHSCWFPGAFLKMCDINKQFLSSFCRSLHQRGRVSDSQGEVLLEVAAVSQKSGPQLHADDPENEEDEEAEEQHITQHGQSVQQQVDQDTETCDKQMDD